MGLPQFIFVLLVGMELAVYAVKHGEYRGVYDFWWALFSDAIVLSLLWWGGFFS